MRALIYLVFRYDLPFCCADFPHNHDHYDDFVGYLDGIDHDFGNFVQNDR